MACWDRHGDEEDLDFRIIAAVLLDDDGSVTRRFRRRVLVIPLGGIDDDSSSSSSLLGLPGETDPTFMSDVSEHPSSCPPLLQHPIKRKSCVCNIDRFNGGDGGNRRLIPSTAASAASSITGMAASRFIDEQLLLNEPYAFGDVNDMVYSVVSCDVCSRCL